MADMQTDLLAILCGKKWPRVPGMRTYPKDTDPAQRASHEGMLELESLGMAYRHFESESEIAWMPSADVVDGWIMAEEAMDKSGL